MRILQLTSLFSSLGVESADDLIELVPDMNPDEEEDDTDEDTLDTCF